MQKLAGKVAVITGDTSDLALAIAQLFVAEGAFITGRQQQLDEAVRAIGRNVTGVLGDVANLADIDRLYDIVRQEKGRVDILFASAGYAKFGKLGDISEALFDTTFGLNMRGTLFTVQKALSFFAEVNGQGVSEDSQRSTCRNMLSRQLVARIVRNKIVL